MQNLMIIFENDVMLGYVASESEARKAVHERAEHVIKNLKKTSNSQPGTIRIFSENIDDGVKVYTQVLGAYINGPVLLSHVITWKSIPSYSLEKPEAENPEPYEIEPLI